MSDEMQIPNGSPQPSPAARRPEEALEDFSRQVTEQLERMREMKLGEALDQVAELVKRYPVAGVATAALAGFVLGRMLRR